MNRRSFLSLLAGASALLSWAKALPQQLVPISPKEFDYPGAIKSFVARKVEAGHKDLFLFKNRSGQWVFQIYDAASGMPTTAETFYLLYGKPVDDRAKLPAKLPAVGSIGVAYGILAVGLEYNSSDTPRELNAKLNRAFRMLAKAREA